MHNNVAPASERAEAAAMLDVPPLPFAFSGLWADFLALDHRRPPTMAGAAPIPIGEIEAYGRIMHGGYVPHEVETLLGLDAIRLRVAAQGAPTREAT